jgi:hypothetical protein
MQIRSPKDRRTAIVRGVTGYDRRKRNRRTSQDAAVAIAPVAPRERAELQADDLDFTIPKRQK